MTSMSASVRSVSLERFNIFEIRSRHSTYGIIYRFQFYFVLKSDGLFRVHSQGSLHFKYVSPSCKVSLDLRNTFSVLCTRSTKTIPPFIEHIIRFSFVIRFNREDQLCAIKQVRKTVRTIR
jgi:hypothetical protein